MLTKTDIVSAIKKQKIIAIIRGVEESKCDALLAALYRGGVCAAEFAFDDDYAKTAEIIKDAIAKYGDKMLIGAGTVTDEKRLEAALSAGAKYVITPVCDSFIVERTKNLEVCTVVGALTPTEVRQAMNCGADFVKLFPADAFGPKYVKALLAPLGNVPIIAFGGITAANVGEYLSSGAVAAGIGSDLVVRKAIEAGDFDFITEKARSYVKIVGDK